MSASIFDPCLLDAAPTSSHLVFLHCVFPNLTLVLNIELIAFILLFYDDFDIKWKKSGGTNPEMSWAHPKTQLSTKVESSIKPKISKHAGDSDDDYDEDNDVIKVALSTSALWV